MPQIAATPQTTPAENNSQVLNLLLMKASQAQQKCDSEEALKLYKQAYKIDPNNLYTIYGMAYTLKNLQNFPESIIFYKQLEIKKYNLPLISNELGTIYHSLRMFDEAKYYYEKALNLKYQGAQWNLAALSLAENSDNPNWDVFEYRLSKKYKISPNQIPLLLDVHQADKKNILITYEQGLGDSLQFCRYLPLISKIAKSTTVIIQKPLINLFNFNFPNISFLEKHPDNQTFDYQISLLSLASLFPQYKLTDPYLFAAPEKIQQFTQYTNTSNLLKIGFAWHGGIYPNSPIAKFIHERRDIPLSQYSFLNIKSADFYSLQIGQHKDEENRILEKQKVKDFTHLIQDFSDTAGLVMNLDLVITTDTSIAHLSGALSKPTILFNRFDGCWRWGVNKSNSKLYPSLKIFNQIKNGDWSQPIQLVNEYICALAEK